MAARRVVPGVLGFTLVVVSCLAGGAAAASAPKQVQLKYELGEGAGDCPSRLALRTAVEERLGYDPFTQDVTAQVLVVITARGHRYRALVRLSGLPDGPVGERRVQADVRACADLVDALALSVSLALDPEAVDRIKRPRRPREVKGGSQPRRALSAPRRPRPVASVQITSEAQPGEAGGVFDGRIGVSLGGTPSPSPEIRVALGYAPGDWGVGAELRAQAPVPWSTAGGTVTAHAAGVGFTGCLRWPNVRVCALGSVGALFLSGEGYKDARTEVQLVGGAGGRFGFSWPVGQSLSIDFDVDVEVPFVLPGIRLGENLVWRADPVQFSLTSGLGWRF